MIKLELLRWGVIMDLSRGPNIITKVLVRGGRRIRDRKADVMTKVEVEP